MNTKTKLFIVLLVIGIGGGLVYTQWQKQNKPTIEATALNKNDNTIDIAFNMSYKGIQYKETIPFGTIWVKHQKGYSFEVIPVQKEVYFFIVDKDKTVLARKKVDVSKIN